MRPSELIRDKKFAEAAELLRDKHDPESRAILAYALCFLQREEEAATLVRGMPQGSLAGRTHSILAPYFASRKVLAERLGVSDKMGEEWLHVYRKHKEAVPRCSLSAVLIVKNEAAHIERCLRSVAPIVDEVVLVDTGSTDGTIEIAQSLGLNLKLGEFEWCDDFSAARNAALELATCDWALWIDADEELEASGQSEILQALIRPQFGGYFISIVNYTGEEGDNSTYTHSAMRLFQRLPGVAFEGRIHEQVVDTYVNRRMPNCNLATATLLHYGYRPSEMQAKGKFERFLTLLQDEVRINPGDAFQWFNLANAYTVTGMLAEAEHAAKTAVSLAKPESPYFVLAYTLLTNALTQGGKAEEALAALKEVDDRAGPCLLTEFERANAFLALGRLDEALAAIDRAFAYEWKRHQHGDKAIYQYKKHVVRGQILSLMRRFDEAIEMFDAALAVNPKFGNSLYLKAATLSAMGRDEEAISHFETVAEIPELRQIGLTGIGRSNLAIHKYSEAARAFEAAWELSPNDYAAWTAWAEACEMANDLETIVRAYSAFANANEPTPEILVNWGRALDRAGQPERALECFSQALQRAPDDPNGYFNCGDLLFRAGSYQDAAHLYERGLRLRCDYAPGWFVLGNCLVQLGLLDGARIAYVEALRIDPKHKGAAHNLDAIQESDEPEDIAA